MGIYLTKKQVELPPTLLETPSQSASESYASLSDVNRVLITQQPPTPPRPRKLRQRKHRKYPKRSKLQ